MTDLLFVYGTLRPDVRSVLGTTERERLGACSTLIGPATMSGRLFDLGDYPVLVAADREVYPVHGMLLRLADAAKTFAWLDRYEDIDPARTASLYERIVRDVRSAAGIAHAWVYQAHAAPESARELTAGVWPAR